MLSSRPGMPRYAAIGLVALSVGCLGPKSQQCESNGASWVCPEALACAAPPTYCANPLEVGACDNQPDGAPCRTAIVPDGLCVDNACQQCSVDIEGCRAIGWNSMTVPSGTYDVVDAVGSGDAWAGGQQTLVHYDGAHWEPDTTFPTLTGIGITSITGTSTGHMFVGTDSKTIYHQVAGAWTTTTTTAIAKAVWADADDDAFAVGLSGDIEQFSGTTWTALSSMTAQTLGAVWGSSASDVYAVGTNGAVTHYNGTSWTATTVGTGTLAAVWGSGPGDVYVGGAGGIWHSTDGSTWMSEDSSDSILALWGDSSSDVFAGTKASGILRSDGTGLWVPLVSPTMVSSISGSGPADAFAATGTQILHYTGSCWSTLASLTQPDTLASVSVASPTAVFAVGDAGAIDRFDGSAWTQSTVTTMGWTGVWARSASDAYAVSTVIDHWDGTSWTSQNNPKSDSLMAVTGTATTEYAVGEYEISSTNGTWSVVSTMFPGTENAIWISDDGITFVAGEKLYSVDGMGDLDPLLDDGTAWKALWGTSSHDVFAAGDGGVIRHYDGTNWSAPMDAQTSVDLKGLWGNGSDDVFAVGDSGTLLHYHAQLWSIVPPPAGVTATFSSVAGSGSTIFVVGPNGTAARLIESAP